MSRFQRGEPEDRDGAYVVRVADSYGVAFWVAMGRTTGGWRVVWDGNAAGGPGSHSYWPSGDCPPLVEWMLASDCGAAPEQHKATWRECDRGWLLVFRGESVALLSTWPREGGGKGVSAEAIGSWSDDGADKWEVRDSDAAFGAAVDLIVDWATSRGIEVVNRPSALLARDSTEQHKSPEATWQTTQPPRVECRWRGGSSEGVGSPTESTGASPIGWRFTGSDGHPLWYPGLPRGWEWAPMEDAERDSPEAYPRPLFLRFDDYEWVVRERDAGRKLNDTLRKSRAVLGAFLDWAREHSEEGVNLLDAVKAKMARLESERDDARAGLGTLREELAAMLDHRDEVLLLRKAEAGWRSWGRRLTRLGPGVTDAGLRARLDALRGPGVHPDLYASMKVESIKRGERLDAWRERVADLGGPAGFNTDTDADLWRRMLHQLARDSTAPVRALLALAVDGKPTHSLERLFDRLDDVLAEAREAIEHGDKVHAAGVEEGRRQQCEGRDESPFIPASWRLVVADPALGAMSFERPDGTMVHWAEGVWSGVSDSRHLSVDP